MAKTEVEVQAQQPTLSLASPEGILILLAALLLDALGALIAAVAIIVAFFTAGAGALIDLISLVVDVVGMVIIGGWYFWRSGQAVSKEGRGWKRWRKRFFNRRSLRFFGALTAEVIPVVGGGPFWTLFVLSFFKNQNK